MKFAKTIRFDKSDLNVFENASEEAEWAISGAFEFSNDLNENLTGKRKQSFANGFLGLDTFGRSTLVSIVSIDESKKSLILDKLANYFIEKYGAPNLNEAKKVAKEEINFMIDICENHEIGSLMAVSRTLEDDGIHEKFRHIPKGDACSNQKIWTTVSEE
jgi:hypothetical protein